MNDFWHPDCLRAMFDKSTDHDMCDMMVAQFVIPRNFNRNGCQNCQCYCKNKSTTIFHGL